MLASLRAPSFYGDGVRWALGRRGGCRKVDGHAVLDEGAYAVPCVMGGEADAVSVVVFGRGHVPRMLTSAQNDYQQYRDNDSDNPSP